MKYVEIVPRAELRPFVRCFWRLQGRGGGAERVLPDGCCEIVFNFADPFRGLRADGTARLQPHFMLVGQLRRFIRIEPTGAVDLLGIRFEPGGLFALLGADAAELTEARVDLDLVSRRLRRELEAAAPSRARLEEALLGRVRPGRAGAAVALIRRHRGACRVDDLAAGVGSSVRGLERVFRREVGVSPKQLSRIERFQSVVRGVERTGRTDWAAAALQCGYYDQAHLVNEFRHFAGLSPAAYFATEHPLSDFFTGLSGSSNT